MKKPVKNLLKTVAAVILIIGAALAYVSFALPKAGKAPDLEVKITPEKVERGKYLAYHVMMCADCHSERNFSLFSGPPHPGTEFSGGGMCSTMQWVFRANLPPQTSPLQESATGLTVSFFI
jgi:hypothetical protein